MSMKTAIANQIVNFRFGAFDQGFETRPVHAQGGDETCTVEPNDDGTWSIRSPNGQQWLSIQEDGSWQARDANGEPGPWERFTREGNTLTELAKAGITRAPVTLVGGGL
jgi:hypothetical protein